MLILRVSQQLHAQLRTARVIGFSRRKSDEGLGEESCAIAPSWQRRGWHLGIVLALGLSGAIGFSRDFALAQISPDRDASNQTGMTTTPALVEAQGWIIGQKGEIILTAQAPTVTPHNPLLIPATACNGF